MASKPFHYSSDKFLTLIREENLDGVKNFVASGSTDTMLLSTDTTFLLLELAKIQSVDVFHEALSYKLKHQSINLSDCKDYLKYLSRAKQFDRVEKFLQIARKAKAYLPTAMLSLEVSACVSGASESYHESPVARRIVQHSLREGQRIQDTSYDSTTEWVVSVLVGLKLPKDVLTYLQKKSPSERLETTTVYLNRRVAHKKDEDKTSIFEVFKSTLAAFYNENLELFPEELNFDIRNLGVIGQDERSVDLFRCLQLCSSIAEKKQLLSLPQTRRVHRL